MAQTGEVVLAFKSNVPGRRYCRVARVIRPESVDATRLACLSRSPLKIHGTPAAVPFENLEIRLIAVSLRLARVTPSTPGASIGSVLDLTKDVRFAHRSRGFR